ncbi:mavicyanin [Vigna radiata var. radiata]|uniref:Mavicyanin n=1 Tax=Vigna radiata var. radiata TaxID=3916 RepID=A0A1S3UQ43_VIGRR|nr:mavicyanin [Vigna radiata var. radiata]
MGLKNTLFLALLAAMVVAKEVFAAQHVVGGSQGWDQSTDFNSWTSGQTFNVGDKLVFKYSSLHSVIELGNESAYKSCDISNPIQSLSTGNDVVKLEKPGTRYFTCGTLGHCSQGMKLKITILKGNANAPSPASSPSSSSSSSSSSFSPAVTTDASSASQCFTSFMFIIALSLTVMVSLF